MFFFATARAPAEISEASTRALSKVNASIHKLNEHIEVAALEQLSKIYLDVLRALLP